MRGNMWENVHKDFDTHRIAFLEFPMSLAISSRYINLVKLLGQLAEGAAVLDQVGSVLE